MARRKPVPAALGWLGLAVAAVIAAGCGKAAPPVASAGDSKTVTVGDVVQLDGSKSTDPAKNPLSFQWSLVSTPEGSKAVLEGRDRMNATFVADRAGEYQVSLVVSNKETASEPVSITITATGGAPVASVRDVRGNPGEVIVLDGSMSRSPSGAPLTFKWTVTDPKAAAVTLLDADTAAPSFRADLVGAYAVSLVVNDGTADSAEAKATVLIAYESSPPVANAGPGMLVSRGTTVTLNGGGSYDPDGTALTYAWSLYEKPAGSAATLTGGDTATPSFVADTYGAFRARLVVTDAGGASSEASVVTVTAVNGAPTVTLTGPATGYVNNDIALDGSASTDVDGDELSYNWSVFAAPPGGSGSFNDQTADGKIDFVGDTPGAYVISLTVQDPMGHSATTAHTVTLSRARSLTVVGGNGQNGAANTALTSGFMVRALDGTTPVPGAQLNWRVNNGSLIGAQWETNVDGNASAYITTGRFAGPGKVMVFLADDPSVSLTFDFTVTAGPPASVAVEPVPGDVINGTLIRVRTVDAYGNRANDASTDSLSFSLDVTSGPAVFDTTVQNSKGTIDSGGGTNSITGTLVGGEFEILLKQDTPGGFSLSLSAPGPTLTLLPFSAWRYQVVDDAEKNTVAAGGWNAQNASPAWMMKSGTAASGKRSYGLERTHADSLASGWSAITRDANVPTSAEMAIVTFKHSVTNPSAMDMENECSAHANMFVAMRSGTSFGNSAYQQWSAPLGGYPTTDSCNGVPSFSTTSGFEQVTFDVTDAVKSGYDNLSLAVINSPNPNTPFAAANWYVDDVMVRYLTAPASTATVSGAFAAGPPNKVEFVSGSSSNYILGQCLSGPSTYAVVSARVLDAKDNPVPDYDLILKFTWDGAAEITGVAVGQLVALPNPKDAEIRFSNGVAAIELSDTTPEVVNVTLTDTRNQGLSLPGNPAPGSPSTATTVDFATNWICHSNGLGNYWSDTTAQNTFDAVQANRACEARYGVGNCAAVGSDATTTSGFGGCNVYYRWTYVGTTYTDVCGSSRTTIAGRVQYVYYITSCSCSSPTTPGPTSSYYFYSANGATWN